jgi:hypothetical protein
VFFNTEVFEVSDADAFKEAMMGFRESLEASGGSDVRVFRNVEKPNQVFTGHLVAKCRSVPPMGRRERRAVHEGCPGDRYVHGARVPVGGVLTLPE